MGRTSEWILNPRILYANTFICHECHGAGYMWRFKKPCATCFFKKKPTFMACRRKKGFFGEKIKVECDICHGKGTVVRQSKL